MPTYKSTYVISDKTIKGYFIYPDAIMLDHDLWPSLRAEEKVTNTSVQTSQQMRPFLPHANTS